MSFEYIDEDTDKLWVDKSRPGSIIIGAIRASRESEDCASVRVPAEDAPAIALAILEAAGIEYVTMAEACNPAIYISPERLAVTRLQEWKRLQDKRAEREAEDAKVRNFRAHQWKAQDENRSKVMPLWDDIDDYGRDLWRTEYRAARRFFEES